MNTEPRPNNNHRKGFASLTPERRRAIASLGGTAAQERGTGRRWTVEQAREAGRRGGLKSRRRPKAS